MVNVLTCGVCGGEYTTYHNRSAYPVPTQGVILGHEMVGQIEEGDSPLCKPGDIVAISPNRGCGQCEMCRIGMPFECQYVPPKTAAVGGGYAEYCLVSPEQCYKLAPDADPVAMALAEPLACCLYAYRQVGVTFGNKVIILGAGAGAQLFVQLARRMGAQWIVVIDSLPDRLELARKMGADDTWNSCSNADITEKAQAMGGADVVVVTRSQPAFLELALALCAFRGRVLCYGVMPASMTAVVSPNLLWKKQLSLIGTRSYYGTFAEAVRLLSSGQIQTDGLITRVIGLDDIESALADTKGHIKTVLAEGVKRNG